MVELCDLLSALLLVFQTCYISCVLSWKVDVQVGVFSRLPVVQCEFP